MVLVIQRSAAPAARTRAALLTLHEELRALDQAFCDRAGPADPPRTPLWTRRTVLSRWWTTEGDAAFRIVDVHARRILQNRFASLRRSGKTHLRPISQLTPNQALNLRSLQSLAARTDTTIVPLGDRALLRPRAGIRPRGHLIDLDAEGIPRLCRHFPSWLARRPTTWPERSLEELAAPPPA